MACPVDTTCRCRIFGAFRWTNNGATYTRAALRRHRVAERVIQLYEGWPSPSPTAPLPRPPPADLGRSYHDPTVWVARGRWGMAVLIRTRDVPAKLRLDAWKSVVCDTLGPLDM